MMRVPDVAGASVAGLARSGSYWHFPTAGGRLENANIGGRAVTMVQVAIDGGGHVQELGVAEVAE